MHPSSAQIRCNLSSPWQSSNNVHLIKVTARMHSAKAFFLWTKSLSLSPQSATPMQRRMSTGCKSVLCMVSAAALVTGIQKSKQFYRNSASAKMHTTLASLVEILSTSLTHLTAHQPSHSHLASTWTIIYFSVDNAVKAKFQCLLKQHATVDFMGRVE
jgi:hypothetical protein